MLALAANGETPTKTTLVPVTGDCTATLKGKVTVKGAVPAVWRGTEGFRIGDNQQVGNVVVFVQPGKSGYFPISERQVAQACKNPIELGMARGEFFPHIAVCFPSYRDPEHTDKLLPTGQVCKAVNDSLQSQSVHWLWGNNVVTPGESSNLPIVPHRLFIQVTNDLNPRMQAYLWAFDHPYAAVSCSDTAPAAVRVERAAPTFGTYEVKGLPAGVKLRLFAWQEQVGWITAGSKDGEELKLTRGENVRNFELVPP
jgi:hypothetical protein